MSVIVSEASDLIDKVGAAVVAEHFGLTPQRLYMWRLRGIPHLKRVAFHRLAAVREVALPADFLEPLFKARDTARAEAA